MMSAQSCPIYGCPAVQDIDAQNYHHRWLVVDHSGVALGPDQCGKLKDVQLSLAFGYLVMKGQGMLRMDIPLDVIEDDESVEGEALVGNHAIRVVDEGNLAAAWVSNFLGLQARLVKVHPDAILEMHV